MTKYLAIGLGALAIALALPPQVSAQTLTANLNGGEETPALNTGAVGMAEVSVDAVNREISITLTVFNIGTSTTAGHIHAGPAGVAGPVIINFPPSLAGRTGDFSMTFRAGPQDFVPRPAIGINTFDDAVQAIVLGNSYVNIHTTLNPGGEIRGRLTR